MGAPKSPRKLAVKAATLALSILCASGLGGCSLGEDEPVRSASPFESAVKGAPKSADRDEFCRTWITNLTSTTGAELFAWAQAMTAIGTPADVSARQRQGFVVLISSSHDFPKGPLEPSNSANPKVTPDEQTAVDDLNSYVQRECEPEIEAAMETDDPSPSASSSSPSAIG